MPRLTLQVLTRLLDVHAVPPLRVASQEPDEE
jgi:hypothetical protein